MKNMWLWIVIVVIILGGVYFMTKKPVTETEIVPEPGKGLLEETTNDEEKETTVTLSEQNDSGENGIVQLVESEGQIKVSVNMAGAPETAQPAHIHAGSCPTPGEVLYPLTNVINGVSETTLDITLENLKSQMPLAINVHKSATESSVYVACGDVSL